METRLTADGHNILTQAQAIKEEVRKDQNELAQFVDQLQKRINRHQADVRELAYTLTEELVVPATLKSGETILIRYGDRFENLLMTYDIMGRPTERKVHFRDIERITDAEKHFFDSRTGEPKGI